MIAWFKLITDLTVMIKVKWMYLINILKPKNCYFTIIRTNINTIRAMHLSNKLSIKITISITYN